MRDEILAFPIEFPQCMGTKPFSHWKGSPFNKSSSNNIIIVNYECRFMFLKKR